MSAKDYYGNHTKAVRRFNGPNDFVIRPPPPSCSAVLILSAFAYLDNRDTANSLSTVNIPNKEDTASPNKDTVNPNKADTTPLLLSYPQPQPQPVYVQQQPQKSGGAGGAGCCACLAGGE
ncbi:hypothetical protein CI109_103385 [Kwoniella shandongensis]|uniref:Cysteine-rich transmembrane CYSTM domain-containing protein n=1 Tax=Kwoniella shandongensis TaxID=1734106 RepID=A0AAJ8LKU6_9TREE